MPFINKHLLPIKLHYILRLGGWGGLSLMLPVLVRQKGVPEDLIGIIWSLSPVIGLFFNSLAGTLSDYFKAHRLVFLMSILVLNAGATLVYFIPDIPSSFSTDINHSPNLPADAVVQFDIHRNITDTNRTNQDYMENTIDLLNILVDDSTNNDMLNIEEKLNEPSSFVNILNCPEFWFIGISILLCQIGNIVVVTMEDSACFILLGCERHKYGKQRMWGTISMGVMAIAIGGLVDLYSRGLVEKDYFPAIAICFTFLMVDFGFVSRMDLPIKKEEKLNFSEVGHIMMDAKVLLVMMSIFVSGLILGVIWAFKLIIVEDVANAWDDNFAYHKLLSGLVVGFETIGGKLPFFFFSGYIIEKLGHIAVFGLVLGTLTIRCLLYSIVSNPWLFLPIELLNGPSFGLLLSVMGSYASVKGPPGAEATFQAILRGSFWLGISCAGALGGILIRKTGSSFTFFCLGAFIGGFTMVYIFLQLIARKGMNNKEIINDSKIEVTAAA